MPDDPGRFAAMVLAGGAGRRLGGAAKPALAVGGVPLLARVLAALADAAPVVVVGPPALATLLPPGAEMVRERPPGGGPVAAVAAGLAHLGDLRGIAVVAVLAGDLPFVRAETVVQLRRAVVGADGAVLVDGSGRPQWLCGVWRPSALRERLTGEVAGRAMRDVVDGLRVARVAIAPSGAPDWFDCDTEEDLRRAEEWIDADPG